MLDRNIRSVSITTVCVLVCGLYDIIDYSSTLFVYFWGAKMLLKILNNVEI